MRLRRCRHVLLPLAAAGLLVSGCSSDNTARRTTTVIAVVTGSQPTAGSGPATGSGITVVPPSGSTAPSASPSPRPTTSARPSTSPKPTTPKPSKTSVSPSPINTKVDPLETDCSALLNAGDIQKIFGTSVPTPITRIRDVPNADRNITGKVRCQYGVKGNDSKVVVGLTQYTDADAVKAQVRITRDYETDKGAKASVTTVKGYPADVLLRDGGLIVMPYGDWSLAIAADSGVIKDNAQQRLQKAAETVLTRVLKGS